MSPHACRFLSFVLGLWTALPALAAEVVQDLAGRSVAAPAKVERLILGEGRFLSALAVLEGKRAAARVVGMLGDFESLDPAGYAAYAEAMPALRQVQRLGQASGESFGVEAAIALRPDLAIFGLEGHGPGLADREILARLEAAGIAVAFIDFRRDPLNHTPRSMRLLGRLLGREAEAEAYNRFYQAELARVQGAGLGTRARPRVFLESRVGLSAACCQSMGRGLMGLLLESAGGDNLAAAVLPGPHGQLSLEYLLTHQPAHYIGTAIGQGQAAGGRILLGSGVSPEQARRSLAAALARPGIAGLEAVREGRAHAIWHHFYNSPFNVFAVQIMAKWLNPERFADLAPERGLAEAYRRFQPVPLNGTYWLSLGGTSP